MDKSLAQSNMNSAPHPPRCWLGRWAAADSGMFGDFWKDPVLEKPPPSRPWFRIRSFSIGRLERKKMGRFQFLFFFWQNGGSKNNDLQQCLRVFWTVMRLKKQHRKKSLQRFFTHFSKPLKSLSRNISKKIPPDGEAINIKSCIKVEQF